MRRALSNGKSQNYNLGANEGFVMFLTSKLITSFVDGFTLGMQSQANAYLQSQSAHTVYIGFWTLVVKCTHYGFCGQVAFKNARTMVFFK